MYFDEDRREVINVGMRNGDLVSYRVLNHEQVQAVEMVIEYYEKDHAVLLANDNQQHNENTKPKVVYIAEYTTHDDYGSLRQQDVFAKEEDAWAFVLEQRDVEGATDISVKPRLVYLDKDRTVDIDE